MLSILTVGYVGLGLFFQGKHYSLPLGEGMPPVRPAVSEPAKMEAVMNHRSRMNTGHGYQ